MTFHLKVDSKNIKTGNIPVTYSSRKTCPDACPFKKNGCYADSGPINIHWGKVTSGERGGDIDYLASGLSALPVGQFGRLNAAGDLPGSNNKINKKHLLKLVKSAKNKKLFTYTHKPVLGNKAYIKNNRKYIKESNQKGLTINLSANSLAHADKLKKLNIAPVVSVVPNGTPKTFFTPNGNKGIICPAQMNKDINCLKCQLCQKQRGVIVGFLPHGVSKKTVNSIAESGRI